MNHGILLKKLQHYGIRGICLQWLTNYLQERTQIVKFKVSMTPTFLLHDVRVFKTVTQVLLFALQRFVDEIFQFEVYVLSANYVTLCIMSCF